MAGYPLPQFDPTQQLNQTPQAQTPPAQPASPAPQQQAPPQQADPLEQVKQSLANQYTAQQQNSQVQGGAIKRLLGNFLQGAGDAGLHHVGLPTAYEQQQRTLTNLQGITNTQAMLQLHAGMASMYGSQPVQMPDGSTQMVPNNQLGRVLSGLMQSQARTQAANIGAGARVESANIGAGARVQSAQINQGMLIPVTPEQVQDLGLPPGTTQVPLRQLTMATHNALAPLGVAQGAAGPEQYNKFNPGAPPVNLGMGNPGIARQDARWTPVAELDTDGNPTGAVHLMRAGEAGASGAITPQSAQFQAGKSALRSATSGAIFNTKQAYDTAIAHMQVFRDAAHALGNGNTLIANRIGQAVNMQFGGDAATNFNIAKQAFAGEVGKAFAGANVAQADRQELVDKISSASSPAQLEGYAATAQKLLEGKRSVLAKGVANSVKGKTDLTAPPTGGTGFAAWKASQGR